MKWLLAWYILWIYNCWYIVKFKALLSYVNPECTFYVSSPALGLESSMDLQISTDNEVYLHLLQPYLSVMLNKGSLEVSLFTGSHSPRRIIRRPDQGTLNDGMEHSLRIERLPGRLVCVCVSVQAVLMFLPVPQNFMLLKTDLYFA